MFRYKTKTGEVLTVPIGGQDLINNKVTLTKENGETIVRDMFHTEDGDIGFIYNNEEIFFHHHLGRR